MAHLRQRSPNIPVSKRSTKRSITIADHKTSVSLENEFWDCFGLHPAGAIASAGSLLSKRRRAPFKADANRPLKNQRGAGRATGSNNHRLFGP
jgi:ribbon-helix-helix protein